MTMRDVVLQMQVTLDGFIGMPDGSVHWALPGFDKEFESWTVESLWQAGVHVMGGETGRGLAAYWPNPTEERDLPYAEAMNRIPKVVFSKSLDNLDWNETRIARGDTAEEFRRLKQEDGGNILVHGGARFVQSLSRLGLIDRYQFMIHPVVLGAGLRPFPELGEPMRLDLLEARTFPSGVTLHVYRPARG
jgi:dihydrofolate reductase